MNPVTDINKGLADAAEGFKQMQKALLLFAAIAGVGLLLAGISLLNKN